MQNLLRIRLLYCSDLLKQVPKAYVLEKNLIFFLTLTPAGICETEVRQLCNIYKKWFGEKFKLLENLKEVPENLNRFSCF